MAPTPKSKKRVVTDEHKAAMATGRTEARAVKNYLEALELHKPKRGRKRTPESIGARLTKIDAELESADPMRRLTLVQERRDLEQELQSLEIEVDLTDLEAAFVTAAKSYGQRKGISYGAWREVGVSAATLKAAGITRSS